MDSEEKAIYESMPDFVDIGKETAAQEPSQEPAEPQEPAAQEDNPQPAELETAPEESPEGQPEEPEDGEEQPKYKVKVDGNEVEVTLDELKSSYMRDADYRRKTMDLAKQRDDLKAREEARDKATERLHNLIADAEKSLMAELQDSEARNLRAELAKVDVTTLNSADFEAYLKAEAHCRNLEERERVKIAKFEETRNKYIAERQKLEQEQQIEDQKILERDIPGFTDKATRAKYNQDITDYLVSIYGEKRAGEIARNCRTKEDYKTLYYAAIGKKFSETKVPDKPVKPTATPVSAANQAGGQVAPSSNKKQTTALFNKIKANGERGAASDDDIVQYLMKKGI